MLITDRFVMINFPKTGSNFAREAIRQAHWHPPDLAERISRRIRRPERLFKDLLMKPIHFNAAYNAIAVPRAHGQVQQIPEEHRKKLIMSVSREPVSRMISLYEFRAWEKEVRPSVEAVKAVFPHFPDLTFNDYFQFQMGLAYQSAMPVGMRTIVGPLTLHFIRFYAHDPLRTALSLRDDTDLRKEWSDHFPQVRFLHTDNLNEELKAFLISMGYSRKSVEFIREKGKVNTSPRTQRSYFTGPMIEEMRWRERLFYQVFPEYLSALHAAKPEPAQIL